MNTAGTGVVWVIRDIIVQTFSEAPVTTFIVVNTLSQGSVYIWARPASGTTVEHLELRQVVNAGESLQAFTDTGEAGVLVTGYRFSTA